MLQFTVIYKVPYLFRTEDEMENDFIQKVLSFKSVEDENFTIGEGQ